MKLYSVKVSETTESKVLVWASSMDAAALAVQNGEGDTYLMPGVTREVTEVIEDAKEC